MLQKGLFNNTMDEEKREMQDGQQMTPHLRMEHPAELMHDIDRLLHQRFIRLIPQMQRSHRLILMELTHKDGVTQLEIVRATHLKAPTVSVSLQKMEEEGLVSRQPDRDDLRAMRVFLTDKGRELDRSILSTIMEQNRIIDETLDPEEFETLRALLKKVRNSILEGEERLETD